VTYKLKVCQHCGEEYQPTGPAQKYCAECGPIVKAKKKKVYGAEWLEANPEKRKAFSKAARAKFYRKNPEKVKAWNAEWAKTNHEKSIIYCSKRRATKYANTPLAEMLMSTEWLAILAAAAGHCHYCDKEAKLTLDHVIPLSRGGKHSKDNVVAACLHCNDSKGTKTLEEWIGMAVIHV
jgi:5-methylcytosine-specific restriction endonuclease McrA